MLITNYMEGKLDLMDRSPEELEARKQLRELYEIRINLVEKLAAVDERIRMRLREAILDKQISIDPHEEVDMQGYG